MDHSSQQRIKLSPVTVQDVSPQEWRLLPATWRDKDRHVLDPQKRIDDFLRDDLLTTRLTRIKDHLWLAGRLLPPRSLHTQILMCRDIVITEQIALHLVWTKGKIFIKPLPRYLLDTAFREKHFPDLDVNGRLSKCARGLLYSYTALIANDSDFRIARAKGLLPSDIEWSEWHGFVRDFMDRFVNQGNIYSLVDERYQYGELRLARLDKISRMTSTDGLLYGYARELATSEYADFFANNFGVVVAVLGYMVIVLTAMQVGLAVKHLGDNSAFNWACYVFTIFSLLAPLTAAVVIMAAFLFMLISHWLRTMHDHRKRNKAMNIPTGSNPTAV